MAVRGFGISVIFSFSRGEVAMDQGVFPRCSYFLGTGSPMWTCNPQCRVGKAKCMGPSWRAVRCWCTSAIDAELYGRTRDTSSRGWVSQSLVMFGCLSMLSKSLGALALKNSLSRCIKSFLSTPTRLRSCVRCQREKSVNGFSLWKESWTSTSFGRRAWATCKISPP